MFAPSHCVVFQCGDFYMQGGPFGDFYACLPKLISSEDDQTLTDVTGTHMSEKTNADVKLLLVNREPLANLPIGNRKFFPELDGNRLVGLESNKHLS